MKWPFSRSKFEYITGKDGAEMVLIPAGEFQMGSVDGFDDEKPVHTVYVDAFYMDVYEVTNALYKKFVDATGHSAPECRDNSTYNAPEQPVVGVSWHDAIAYAEWSGKRLPTEAEWEKAARGGLKAKKYPWGDKLTHGDANYSGTGGKDRWDGTSPVGSFSANGYGLYDMAGNVYEWCADWYDSGYYSASPERNPTGPSSGTGRVLRGGSWDDKQVRVELLTCYTLSQNLQGDNCDNLRVSDRNYYGPPYAYAYLVVGFRCVSQD